MKISHPNRKVGLTVFNNDVALLGDCQSDPVFIVGDRLDKFEDIKEISTNSSQKLFNNGIEISSDAIIAKFEKLEEKGATAMGPALLASVCLAAK